MRNTQLDALRAIAVLLVLGNHFQINFTWFRIGWTGVDLFFVLSGFLIAGILFREIQATGELQIGRFLLRRGLKIYPAYYGLLFGTLLYDVITRVPLPLPKEIFADLAAHTKRDGVQLAAFHEKRQHDRERDVEMLLDGRLTTGAAKRQPCSSGRRTSGPPISLHP